MTTRICPTSPDHEAPEPGVLGRRQRRVPGAPRRATRGEHGPRVGRHPDPRGRAARARRRRRQGHPRARLRRGAVVDRAGASWAPGRSGIDLSERQLEHARRLMAEAGLDFPLIHGERRARAAARRVVRHRVLRPRRDDLRRPVSDGAGGRPTAPAGRTVRVQPPHADRIDRLAARRRPGQAIGSSSTTSGCIASTTARPRRSSCRTASGSGCSATNGLVVEDLIEPRPAEGATSSYRTPRSWRGRVAGRPRRSGGSGSDKRSPGLPRQVLPAVRAVRVGDEVAGPAGRAAFHAFGAGRERALARRVLDVVPMATQDQRGRRRVPTTAATTSDDELRRLIHRRDLRTPARPPARPYVLRSSASASYPRRDPMVAATGRRSARYDAAGDHREPRPGPVPPDRRAARCSATRSACWPTSASRPAPPRSTRPASSPRTCAGCSPTTTSSRCRSRPSTAVSGGELLSVCLAVEQLSRACATTGLILAVQELGSLPITLAGTPEQQARWFPKLASGEQLIAFALTEAEAGSDAAAARTTAARRDGDDYVIDGVEAVHQPGLGRGPRRRLRRDRRPTPRDTSA